MAVNQALEASEAKDVEQQAQIADLGSRLNQALAQKVQELQQEIEQLLLIILFL